MPCGIPYPCDLNDAASDTARRRMFRRGIFCRSLSETMALPLSTVVRVLRERRVVEKLPLAWRTAVRPSLMRRCARGWAQCDAAAIGEGRMPFVFSHSLRLAARALPRACNGASA